MVKIDVAKSVNFNELIYSKEAEVVSMRILNQPNSYVSLFSLAKNEEIRKNITPVTKAVP